MRREGHEDVSPAEEELPERESGGGMERVAEEETTGVEREAPVEESVDPRLESPPADADRASLLP